MTKGYAIFTEVIRDQAGYRGYADKAGPGIRRAGGRAIAVDDQPQVLEGRWHGTRTVVLEFDSPEAARAWYDSAEYRAIIGERLAAAEANAVILRGVAAPA